MAIDKNKILEYYLKLKNSIKPGEWKSSEINLSPEQDTISKFSHSGDDTTEIKKILLEYEEGTRGTQSNETASKGKKVGLYTDSKLEEIAKKYFNVETLETRKSDSIDFKDVAVWNIKSALAEAGRDMLSDSELEKIAKDQLFLDTLKTRNSDSLDFSEQSVWGLKGALQEANHLGVQKLRNTAKTGTQIEQGVWDFDTEGNLYTMVDRTKYKIVYRDDESKLYDLFEDGKLIYSDRSIFKLKQEVMPKETAAKGKNVDAPLSYEGITEEDIDKYYGASIPMPGERNAELFKRHRELHKALLHFEKDPNSKFYINTAKTGTKINEMKNNYYYLKIGNVIKEPKYNNSLEIVAFERDKIKVKEISKILKNTTADFIDYETFVSYMNFGDITIEGCTYETDRDKLLLKMEIDNIQASFKESEFKQQANTLMAEASTAKTEANQVKKEANALLNKLESKTKGFEDTLAGVEALNTEDETLADDAFEMLSSAGATKVLSNSYGISFKNKRLDGTQNLDYSSEKEGHRYVSRKELLKAIHKLTPNTTKPTNKNSVWDNKLNAFLAQFPNDAKSWKQATEEIREIAADVRGAYNEQVLDVVEGDSGYVEGLDFKEFGKPHQWNTEAKKFILNYWVLLPESVKKNLIERREGWFDDKAKSGKKIDSDFYIGEVVQVTKGHYRGKNGTISDLDADKNHVEVTMGDEMVRFLELADIKKIESGAKPTKMVSKPKAKKGAKIDYVKKLSKKHGNDPAIMFKAIELENAKLEEKKKKKSKSKGPKRGKTTLGERNYMKKFKKEFEALKDAYPDSTFKELIEKHKNANKK